MRKLLLVPKIRKNEMRKYLFDYLTELSQFDPDVNFDKNGVPIYKWFDCYWEDKDRFPFYFLVDNKIAGIAMIRELDNMVYDFAEFYVCPEFRKDGNAIWLATEIANLFEGQFVFSTRHTNPRAIKFWEKFATLFKENEYYDDEIWRNFIIRKNKFKNHQLGLMPKYFKLIKNGKKIFEGRLNDEKRQKYNVGDILVFCKEPDRKQKIYAKILDKLIFKNFDEMVKNIKIKDLGFFKETKEEVVDIYRSVYSKEDEKKYGVAIFKIEKF